MDVFTRTFDASTSVYWNNSAELNQIFIQLQQNYANQKLRVQGHIFLNEIFDALGMTRTSQGQIVGWLWNDDGDCYVDFGLDPFSDEAKNNLAYQLNFNVDGVIYEKI